LRWRWPADMRRTYQENPMKLVEYAPHILVVITMVALFMLFIEIIA